MSDTTTRERWGYAAEERTRYWEGSFKTREEAIEAGRGEYGSKDDFGVARGTLIDLGDHLPAPWQIVDLIYEDAGDVSGDQTVTPEAEAELQDLLEAWAAKHLHTETWQATGDAELVKAGAA